MHQPASPAAVNNSLHIVMLTDMSHLHGEISIKLQLQELHVEYIKLNYNNNYIKLTWQHNGYQHLHP